MNINATLLVEILIFGIFIFLTMRFVWPPLNKILETRRAKIAQGLASAEKSEKALDAARQEATRILIDAKRQGERIIREAEERAAALGLEIQQRSEEQVKHILEEGRVRIEIERREAEEALKKEAVNFAIQAATQILAAELDEKKHSSLVIRLAQEGAAR